jgi:polysaccharide biosynthesis/export protein
MTADMKTASPLFCLLAFAMIGCTTVPTSGPTASQVIDQAKHEGQGRYDFVEIDPAVVMALATRTAPEHPSTVFGDQGKPRARIGIGDLLSVSIWQSGAGGVGAASAGTSAGGPPGAAGAANPSMNIPDQIVGTDGAISVPFAGRVQVAGRTPFDVQKVIEDRLANRVIEPQVIVTVARSVADTASISGEDMAGSRVPLTIGGDRLLDVIDQAGGTKSPLYETFVKLTRDGQTVTIPMEDIVSNPAANIYVWPHDVITLVRRPETFSVFGATVNNVDVPFGATRLDLAQAIAKAGGLQDSRADPEGVFLFRFEPPDVVQALGQPSLAAQPGAATPVLYHLNLREAASYFLAKRFPMQNDDMIYVSNATMAELQKFFTLVGTISGPVIGGAVLSRGSGH